jgi:uncharacterized membrane protein
MLSLWKDRRGAAGPIVAILGAVLLGSAGVALDGGLYYVEGRNLQAVTEAAALSAAIFPGQADARARSFLQQNGYAPSVLKTVEVGRYCVEPGSRQGQFFATGIPQDCLGNGVSNAVRLTTSGDSHQYLTGAFGRNTIIPALSGKATAARIDEAGLEVTSGFLGLDVGLVNSLLSALAGTNIALAQAQLTNLVGANVDAGYMFDALATQVGESGSYSDLLNRTVSLGDLLTACQTSLNKTGGSNAASALQTLIAQAGNVRVPLAGLFSLGVWKNMPVGRNDAKQALRAGLNSYQLIFYALQSGNRTPNGIALTSGSSTLLSLSGIAVDSTARPRFAFGPAGEVSVYTAAMRIALRLNLSVNATALGSGLTLGGTQPLDLVVELGQGSATIDSISCQQDAASDTVVQTTSSAGLVNVYLGTLANPLRTPLQAQSPAYVNALNVTLLGIPVINVGLRASLGPVIGSSPTGETRIFKTAGGDATLGHTYPSPVYAGTAARVGSTSQLANTLSALGTGLDVKLTLLGIIPVSLSSLVQPITTLLANTLQALRLDTLVTAILSSLGLQAGYADTWVTGARCGVPVLV